MTLAIGQMAALATTGGSWHRRGDVHLEQRQLHHRQHHAHRRVSGGCTVTATKAADTNYNQATATVAVTTSLNAQTITFGANPGPVTYAPAGTFTVSATGGGSLNPVTFSSTTSGICTTGGANGATVTIVTAGTCIIAADQAGNTTHAAASQVPQSIVINKASQAVLTATATLLTLAIGQTAALRHHRRHSAPAR
ncbi:MAG: hypothetical protein IPP88_22225 [Betaproteobacteria bacterium]|nr:hypothetical protein [Betaproteobacteria bacterium]